MPTPHATRPMPTLPAQMRTERIGDVDLHYGVAGQGPPVLFVMGFGVRGRAWRFQLAELAAHHQVIWFDNRGVGGSGVNGGPYSMGQLAGDAVGLLDHLGLQQAHVVGVSMGGMVSQHIALDAPERVRSLSLVASSPGGGALTILPRVKGLLHFLRSSLARSTDRRLDSVSKLLFPKPFRKEVGQDWLIEVLRDDFGKAADKAGRSGQFRAILKHDTRRRLAELGRIPTLVVKPERDLLIKPKRSERLHAGIPGSRMLRIPEAGHGIIRQAHEALNAALLAHFAHAEANADGSSATAAA